jgi:hypothetical protein
VPPPAAADEGGGSSFLKNCSRLLCNCKQKQRSMS